MSRSHALACAFADLGVTDGLQGKTIYDLILSGFPSSLSKESVSLNITVTPQNATVIIDSEIMETNGGRMSAILPEGNHQYMIAARGYLSAEGTLTLRPGRTSNFRFDLEKAAAKHQTPVVGNTPMRVATATSSVGIAHVTTPKQLYLEGKKYYDEEDFTHALPLFLKSAKDGYAIAQIKLGYMYQFGLGVPIDHKLSAEWYVKAMYHGEKSAAWYLSQEKYQPYLNKKQKEKVRQMLK